MRTTARRPDDVAIGTGPQEQSIPDGVDYKPPAHEPWDATEAHLRGVTPANRQLVS